MGILRDVGRGVEHALAAHVVLGRSTACQLRVDAAYVSSQHAALRWTGEGWEVRDVGSRNGTFLDGRRLPPGEGVLLPVGAILTLGRASERWTLVDGSAPAARAVSGADQRWARDGLLLLPDPAAPEICVYADGRGGWTAEEGERRWKVTDGREVRAGGRVWILQLPSADAPLADEVSEDTLVDELTLRVTADGAVAVEAGGHAWLLPDVPDRVLLVALARARVADAPELPEHERGWVHHEALAQELGLGDGRLNVAVLRLRQRFKEAGIPGGGAVLERRRGSGQVRLAVGQVVFDPPAG